MTTKKTTKTAEKKAASAKKAAPVKKAAPAKKNALKKAVLKPVMPSS